MKSETLPSFWKAYKSLDKSIRERAKKAYLLWEDNPFHLSLHFKCIKSEENIWAVRITLGIRALGVLDDDTVTWFWIGGHDEYERYFS
jgi:mRNA-degrading endonuclease RelE of RelBE toxin-antitoxin system